MMPHGTKLIETSVQWRINFTLGKSCSRWAMDFRHPECCAQNFAMKIKSGTKHSVTVVSKMFIYLFFIVIIGFNGTSALRTGRQRKILSISTPDGTNVQSTLSESGYHYPIIVVDVATVQGEAFILDLRINRMLFSTNYREKVCSAKGDYFLNFNESADQCYYLGNVRGFNGSRAYLETCRDISGFFEAGNNSYTITPLPGGAFAEAIVELEVNSDWMCGVTSAVKRSLNGMNKRSIDERMDGISRFIELYAVSDYTHFKQFASEEAAASRIKGIVNAANSLYNSVNMYVILVGIEVWTTQKITIGDSLSTLENFYDYKNQVLNLNASKHDNACLFLNVNFDGGVIGLADVGSMCNSRSSGYFICDRMSSGFSTAAASTILTHEMGHNFGLVHDPKGSCSCYDQTGLCIMTASIRISNPPTTFSSCSKTDLIQNRKLGLDLCLFNVPETLSTSGAVCGNGILEVGEDCDCGNLPEDICNPDCCKNCRLAGAASCAMGFCCDLNYCNISISGTICRPSLDSCDIQEVCDGNSAFCPIDSYKHDGLECSVASNKAYCYQGKCQNHQSQCKKVWGNNATVSPVACYSSNLQGNDGGSCQIALVPQVKYTKCSEKDVMCGQLFCNIDDPNPTMRTNYSGSQRGMCAFAIFDFGPDVLTPGYVPNGAVCNGSMVCLNQSCVNVEVLTSVKQCQSCDAGVCDNNGTCRCVNGLQYPNCTGPTYIRVPRTTTPRIFLSKSPPALDENLMVVLLLSFICSLLHIKM